MAKSVKYTVNFLEAKEEDLYRSVCAVCVCYSLIFIIELLFID